MDPIQADELDSKEFKIFAQAIRMITSPWQSLKMQESVWLAFLKLSFNTLKRMKDCVEDANQCPAWSSLSRRFCGMHHVRKCQNAASKK